MRRSIAVVAVLLAVACASTRAPSGDAIAPLGTTSSTAAAQQLALRRSNFRGERSLIRLRLPVQGHQMSTRAQLQIDERLRMLLTLYTPVGTTAARLFVGEDDIVFINDIEKSAWRGRQQDFKAAAFNYFGANVDSRALVLLLIGLPPEEDLSLQYTSAGMAEARVADAVVTYDPPAYPPQKVIVTRGDQRMEIEHLQSVSGSEGVVPPDIPSDYRCCVLPQL